MKLSLNIEREREREGGREGGRERARAISSVRGYGSVSLVLQHVFLPCLAVSAIVILMHMLLSCFHKAGRTCAFFSDTCVEASLFVQHYVLLVPFHLAIFARCCCFLAFTDFCLSDF